MVEPNSLDIRIVVPTKMQSKCMMRCKGKETSKYKILLLYSDLNLD